MTMSKAYGPTGISYMMQGSDFIKMVQSTDTECRLELACGNYTVIDLSKHTYSRLADTYKYSHGFSGYVDDGQVVVQFSKLLFGPSLY